MQHKIFLNNMNTCPSPYYQIYHIALVVYKSINCHGTKTCIPECFTSNTFFSSISGVRKNDWILPTDTYACKKQMQWACLWITVE
jgi:hypothetical protein